MKPAFNAPLPYRALRWLAWLLIRLLTRTEVSGVEHVPLTGPLVVAPNHLFILDPVFMLAVLPRRMTVFAADKWRGTLGGWLMSTFGNAIYVARGEPDRQALGRAARILEAGGGLGVAPEGTRSRVRSLLPGKNGTVYLASRTGAVILPVAIWGQETALRDWLHLRRPRVHVRIAPAMELPPAAKQARTADLQEYTDELMLTIARMLPPAYRGVYAERAGLQESGDGGAEGRGQASGVRGAVKGV
jgi:1-acyl-sn-glycerol-3-phosphate acyltransferase